MNSISFDNVYLLLIAVPLIALFAIPFALAVRKKNRNAHNIVSMVFHVLFSVIIAFAAAGTMVTVDLTETDVFVVADVSYSAKNNLDTIDRYIRELKLPRNSKLGLVCFGKDYELVSGLDDPRNVKSVKEANVDDSATNIVGALNYTGKLFGTGVIKRIVLITDGTQTDMSEQKTIRRAVDELITQNIKVDAIFLDDNPNLEEYKEVQISGVDVTGKVYLESRQTAKVTVVTSYETDADLLLICNGAAAETKRVRLTVGVNTVEFALDTSIAGVYDYQVSVSATKDAGAFNNSYFFTQTVSEEMKVLAVTQNWSDCVAIVERYGEKGILDVYESDPDTSQSVKLAFKSGYAQNENINIRLNDRSVPLTLEEICAYDEIVLASVDIGSLVNFTQFINSLDKAVAVYGKSLVTMGNMFIQNREDDDLRQLEDMLPVKYGNRGDEPKLYTLIIDASRSMGHLYHLAIAKELSARLVNLLNDNDFISIFKFDGEVEAVYNAKSLKDREEIIKTIENFEIANGTVIGSGMQRAYEQIRHLQYSDKQVMLISDGIAYGDDEYDPVEVAAAMYADEIVTSVFDVGRQGDRADGSNVNATLNTAKVRLENIAKEGHGKYYYSNNVEYLDDVTFGDIADDMTNSVVEADTSVNVEIPRDAIFAGIDLMTTKFPDVSGYVYGGLKPSATTVLTVNHLRITGTTVEKPLFAHWKYGYGKVSTFTSSIGEWTQNWSEELKDVFFDNLFETNVPSEKNSSPYNINVIREGSHTRIEAELAVPRLNASAGIELSLPNGNTITAEMAFNGTAYYYEFEMDELGKYAIDITYTYKGVDYCEYRAIYVCYLDEYDAFSIFDSSELHKALDGRGTVSEDGALIIENDPKEVGKLVYSLTVPLLLSAIALVVVDIAVRKLKWADIVSFLGLSKKEGKK